MNQLNEAFAALKLAKESNDEHNRGTFEKAFEGLVALRGRILRYDQKLNDDEVAPTGDDYNEVIEMLGLAASQQVRIGKLWWNADNMTEAEQWKSQYLAKGAISVELKPDSDRPIVGVIITLDRNRAQEILGHAVENEEWLDLSEDEAETPPSPAQEKPEKVYVVFGSLAISPLVNHSKVNQDVLEGFNEFEFATPELADAFMAGVESGCGWLEYHVPGPSELKKIQRKLKRQRSQKSQILPA